MSGSPVPKEEARWVGIATVFMLGGILTASGGFFLQTRAGVNAGYLLMVSGAVTYIASAWVWSP